VSIWHGTEDKHAPFPLVRHFHTRLKQVVYTSWMKGAGHYMLFHHWPAIEKQLCTKKKGKSGAGTLALLAWASSLLFGKHLELWLSATQIV
ncbi:MAG: hypothetical protein Q9M23_04895, partial [Mariprofundaceae bacterium]|nr:hypothetical protein [Mariprofundaceae bacterium]